MSHVCRNSVRRERGGGGGFKKFLGNVGASSVFDSIILLDGGWTTKSPADGNKSLSLPKSICSQEVVSSCLGKDLSAWRRSPISGTDYSGRDHITVKGCFWIARLVIKHS